MTGSEAVASRESANGAADPRPARLHEIQARLVALEAEIHKLSAERLAIVRELHDEGQSQRRIGMVIGLSPGRVFQILNKGRQS